MSTHVRVLHTTEWVSNITSAHYIHYSRHTRDAGPAQISNLETFTFNTNSFHQVHYIIYLRAYFKIKMQLYYNRVQTHWNICWRWTWTLLNSTNWMQNCTLVQTSINFIMKNILFETHRNKKNVFSFGYDA